MCASIWRSAATNSCVAGDYVSASIPKRRPEDLLISGGAPKAPKHPPRKAPTLWWRWQVWRYEGLGRDKCRASVLAAARRAAVSAGIGPSQRKHATTPASQRFFRRETQQPPQLQELAEAPGPAGRLLAARANWPAGPHAFGEGSAPAVGSAAAIVTRPLGSEQFPLLRVHDWRHRRCLEKSGCDRFFARFAVPFRRNPFSFVMDKAAGGRRGRDRDAYSRRQRRGGRRVRGRGHRIMPLRGADIWGQRVGVGVAGAGAVTT